MITFVMFSFRLFFCCYQTCCPWTGIDTIVPSSMGTIVIPRLSDQQATWDCFKTPLTHARELIYLDLTKILTESFSFVRLGSQPFVTPKSFILWIMEFFIDAECLVFYLCYFLHLLADRFFYWKKSWQRQTDGIIVNSL